MSAIIRTHENYLRSKCPKLDYMFTHARSVTVEVQAAAESLRDEKVSGASCSAGEVLACHMYKYGYM